MAVPSDGADTFAAESARIADDVGSLSSWWTGQDATRVPRFDEATFESGDCLDISFLRLTAPAASLATAGDLFAGIAINLSQSGLESVYKKYLVYYDGPSPATNLCGVGGGSVDGRGLAVVVSSGCPDVPTDTVATHELLHALGAVPPGDPNACPNDSGHPCDSPIDVLYPYTHGESLSQKVLDFNHDDYYAHSGSWPDIQDSFWLRHLDTPEEALALAFGGAGTVISDVPGVDCAAACTTEWDEGSAVTLTAQPASGSRFVGWRGACRGAAPCEVTLTQPQSVMAQFGPLTIPVRVAVTGRGRVACTPPCTKAFTAGEPLRLRAVAAKGWRFVRWSGACAGKRPTCAPATDFALSVRATFRRPAG